MTGVNLQGETEAKHARTTINGFDFARRPIRCYEVNCHTPKPILMFKELSTMTLHFDPCSPDFRRDPYPFYDLLRSYAPIFHWETRDITFFTRHEDCSELLRDNRLGHSRGLAPPEDQVALFRMMDDWMLLVDPPKHTRLRGLVHKAFTPRMVEQLRGTIHGITDHLLDQVQTQGHMDLITDLAYPLPVTVIAEMLGVPHADRDILHQWSDALGRSLGPDRRSGDPSASSSGGCRVYRLSGWPLRPAPHGTNQ